MDNPTKNRKLVGNRIREVLKRINIRQRDYAKLCKKTPHTIGKWCRGSSPIDAEGLSIMQQIGVRPSYLLLGDIDSKMSELCHHCRNMKCSCDLKCDKICEEFEVKIFIRSQEDAFKMVRVMLDNINN